MHLETFLKHWGLSENPFTAEEAREDPIFGRLIDSAAAHTDFDKVLGQPDRPGAAVVFGEKGSGKTAIRLMMERRIEQYNAERTDGLVWVVRYDDLNAVLDRIGHASANYLSEEDLLRKFRLEDHFDAILSLATTRLVNLLLGEDDLPVRGQPNKTARKLPRRQRLDLAKLAALYDQPRSGNVAERWRRLRRMVRVGLLPVSSVVNWLGLLALLTAAGAGGVLWLMGEVQLIEWIVIGMVGAAGLLLLGGGLMRWWKLWRLSSKLRRELRAVDRQPGQLHRMLGQLPGDALNDQPLPVPGDTDARYQLMNRLLDVLEGFGYSGLIVLVDRVDEPTAISGDPERMRQIIWPMLNNKFLQQDRVGVKLLLPIELRHLLVREGADFFQQARLDKQHLVERLTWSGHLLYDMCCQRIRACQNPGAEPISLVNLFAEDVSRQDLIDALEQMHQPRDAFKFIYRVFQEHCGHVAEDEPSWRVPRLTLDFVRREQSQRVQEFYRGLSPS